MKLFFTLAAIGVVAAGFGLYALNGQKPTRQENTQAVAPTPTAMVTPIASNQSLATILGASDSILTTEQAAANTADSTSTDTALSAEDQALTNLDKEAGLYAN